MAIFITQRNLFFKCKVPHKTVTEKSIRQIKYYYAVTWECFDGNILKDHNLDAEMADFGELITSKLSVKSSIKDPTGTLWGNRIENNR